VNQTQIMLVIAVVMGIVLLVFLLLLLPVVRLKTQALLTNTPVGVADILRMRLRRCPPHLIVHAAIELRQRGVAASVRDIEVCYLATAAGGAPVATASELADLVEEVKRNDLGSPPPWTSPTAK
jgi:uncharacterized protein YqfA (UPF0365 family)